MNEEEMESIPWATLIEQASPDRSRLIYIAAGALIVFAVAAIAGRALLRPSPTITPSPVVATSGSQTTTTQPPPTAAAALFSEADLMAALDGESARAAAAFAEWFTYDYFTVDGEAATLVDLENALPPGAPMDLLPHAETDQVTYVEWARAAEVIDVSPGRFEVLVFFRVVTAAPGEEFSRQPVRAITVPLQMSDRGGMRLTDLPATAHVPSRPVVSEWRRPTGPGNPSVAGAAFGLSWGGRGDEFRGIGAEEVDGEWRALFTNELGGTAWPFVLPLPDLPD